MILKPVMIDDQIRLPQYSRQIKQWCVSISVFLFTIKIKNKRNEKAQ